MAQKPKRRKPLPKTKVIDGRLHKLIFRKCITRRGKRICHPRGGVYAFYVPIDK